MRKSQENIAVIFAGGVGSRMHSKERPKQFLEMHGKPIIIHTLELFEQHEDIDAIAVACIEEWIPYLEKLVEKFNIKKVKKIVKGGKTGQESIYNALCAAKEISTKKDVVVLIHDGVRPLIKHQTISDNIESVEKNGTAITSVAVKETVLMTSDNSKIDEIPDRSKTKLARAPQSFWLDEILEAHRKAIKENKCDFVDSCSMLQYYGKKLYLIDGPQENIKITTPDDFYTMRALLDAREDEQIYGLS